MVRRLSYREIAAEIADEIASGWRPAKSKLPSYSELAELYDVSVATAHRAIKVLRDEMGMVYGEPGRGVFVAPSRYWRNPNA